MIGLEHMPILILDILAALDKVIIEKFHSEVSVMEQDTIENVS